LEARRNALGSRGRIELPLKAHLRHRIYPAYRVLKGYLLLLLSFFSQSL